MLSIVHHFVECLIHMKKKLKNKKILVYTLPLLPQGCQASLWIDLTTLATGVATQAMKKLFLLPRLVDDG